MGLTRGWPTLGPVACKRSEVFFISASLKREEGWCLHQEARSPGTLTRKGGAPSRPSSALPADGLRGGSGPFSSSCPGRPNVPLRGIAWRREKKSLWDVPAPNQQCVSPGCDPECWGRGVGTLCRLQDVPLGRRISGQPSWVTWDLEADLSFVLFGFHLGLRLLCAGGNCALLGPHVPSNLPRASSFPLATPLEKILAD